MDASESILLDKRTLPCLGITFVFAKLQISQKNHEYMLKNSLSCNYISAHSIIKCICFGYLKKFLLLLTAAIHGRWRGWIVSETTRTIIPGLI